MARQRTRTQIQFIADENLSAMLNLEASLEWGRKATGMKNGGRLDADETTFVIKRAYLDWTIPNTQVKTRMGIQGISMPTVAFGNPVLNADVAGVTVSTQFTPELGLTVFWARPYDRSWDTTDQTEGKNSYDDMDVFGFTLPVKTDFVRFTPWAMGALIGRDSDYYNNRTDATLKPGVDADDLDNAASAADLVKPATYKSAYNYHGTGVSTANMDSNTYGWWAGTTFELPVIDPFFVKIDAMMGGLETGDSDYDTFGWMVAGNIGYKFSWGSLSAMGWYASGNDDDDDHGFLPIISDDSSTFGPVRYAMGATYARSHDALLSSNGIGMWGMGIKVADVSFVDDLKHTFNVLWMGGTNKADSIGRRDVNAQTRISGFGDMYLMSSDRAWEIDLLNEYKVNEYLKLGVDFAYVWLDLGDHWKNSDDTKGSFATMLSVTYSF